MSRIQAAFERLKKERRPAFIPYVMAGDPDLSTTRKIVLELARQGADLVELGVPFSDPLADGPVIQRAAARALESGTTIAGIFRLVRDLRRETQVPIVLMTYYNPVLQHGLERTVHDAQRSGADGFIIPDLTPEEAGPWRKVLRGTGIDFICLAAPTTPPDRLKTLDRVSSGFLYYVSLTGVTGAKLAAEPELRSQVGRVRRAVSLPVAVGFGIKSPAQAAQVGAFADGVIVGSALVSRIESAGRRKAAASAGRFAKAVSRKLRANR